ncbi:PIN domain-containing protein [Streptomyces albidoflavus]
MDTNILRRMQFDGPMADIIRVLQTAGTQRVAVPWVVQEEYAAQKAITYREAHQKAQDAMGTLKGLTPWWSADPSLQFDEDRLRNHWRRSLRKLVDILPASEAALREGVFREANAIAPCKQNKNGKTDFRDAVIWATVMEYARKNVDETVYFVSEDKSAFGDGTSYRGPMKAEVDSLGDRFVHLTALEQVLDRFTSAVAPDVDEVTVTEQLRSRESTSYIRMLIKKRAMTGGDRDELIPAAALDHSSDHVAGPYWDGTPQVLLSSVHQVRAVGIDDHAWSLARVRWIAVGNMRALFTARRYGRVPAATTWETHVLLGPPHEKQKLVVLDAEPPRPSSKTEIDALPPELVARLLATSPPYDRYRDRHTSFEEVLQRLAGVDADLEGVMQNWQKEREVSDQDPPGTPL